MDLDVHEIDYLAQSHWHHFRYRVGEMVGLDRAAARGARRADFDDEGAARSRRGALVPATTRW